MFEFYADKNQLTVKKKEPITSGSVNVYRARFEFSDDWDGLERTAIFQAGCRSRPVILDENGECDIPWEPLEEPGYQLVAGVIGKRGDEVVLPTVWARLGIILEGTSSGEEDRMPTPELWAQELAKKGDALGYTEDGKLALYSGDRVLSSVPVEGGGTGDHRSLSHRDDVEQHPIEAISGLDEIPNKRVLEIWNGVMSDE